MSSSSAMVRHAFALNCQITHGVCCTTAVCTWRRHTFLLIPSPAVDERCAQHVVIEQTGAIQSQTGAAWIQAHDSRTQLTFSHSDEQGRSLDFALPLTHTPGSRHLFELKSEAVAQAPSTVTRRMSLLDFVAAPQVG